MVQHFGNSLRRSAVIFFLTLAVLSIGIGSSAALSSVLAQVHSNTATPGREPANTREIPEGAFAVVEYFTSENCLSCRQSSEIIRQFDDTARKNKQGIIVLSYHIDTVNDALWKDKLMRPEFSERQRKYAQQLGRRRAAPDSLVINGQHYLNGEDVPLIRRAIVKELFKRPLTEISAALRWAGESLTVEYQVTGLERLRRPFFKLVFAVAEKQSQQLVEAGPNLNQLFRHTNSVRVLLVQRIDSEGSGSVEILLPTELQRENSTLVMFVQDPQNQRVVGAKRMDFDSPAAELKPK